MWLLEVYYPLAETDDRPQGTSKCTTAANTATEEPLHINWESLLENAVHTHHCRFVLLRSNTRHQPVWKFSIKSVAETKPARKEISGRAFLYYKQ
jgi:DNA polymerase III delta prime subunit